MTDITDIDPEALEELRELGYVVASHEQAIDAAQKAYGIPPGAAAVYLGGRGDLVEVPD